MDTATTGRRDRTAPLTPRHVEPPSLSRRIRFGSALASVSIATVLLASVVLGLTGMAGPPALDTQAAAGVATRG